MLLPRFELVRPTTLAEAVHALETSPGPAMLMAGGTDLVPAMKNGVLQPARVVSLSRVEGLRDARVRDDGSISLGAGMTLAEVAHHPALQGGFRALAVAASRAAGPQIRFTGTLGGNLCLPPRCLWYNQSEFWRGALGGCLRADGPACRVVEGGQNCVAAMNADTPAALLALGARARVVGPGGERHIPVEDFFTRDGMAHLALRPHEIVASVELPPPAPGLCSSYQRMALRNAIDFPTATVGAAAVLDGRRLVSLRLGVGVLAVQPRLLRGLEAHAGAVLDESRVETIAREAFRQCRPLPNIDDDPAYRRELVPVLVRRALAALAAPSPQ